MKRLARVAQTWTRVWRAASAAVAVVVLGGCVEWQQSVASDRPTIANYISAVTALNGTVTAQLRSGNAPTGRASPIVTAPIPQIVLLGGTIHVTASSPTPFSKVAVVIPELDDYWELTLPAATTSAQLLVVFGQTIPQPEFALQLAGSTGGAYGTYQESNVSVINAGSGSGDAAAKGSSKIIATANY